jgi:ribosomal protein S18 acetylase RimI-like enzyme
MCRVEERRKIMASDDMLSQLRWIEQSVSLTSVPDMIECGVFRAFLSPHTADPERNYAMITATPSQGRALAAEIATMRATFADRQRRLRLEFVEELWPELAAAAEHAGLWLVSREPLMTCTPANFQFTMAPGVRVRFLSTGSDEADLTAYLAIRDEHEGPVDPVDIARLRAALVGGRGWFALASVEDAPAGTGRCAISGEGLGEITAIVTRAELRRRGVAATTTSVLVRECFSAVGTLAWLTAANDQATSVYRRIGFGTIGHLLNYEDPIA